MSACKAEKPSAEAFAGMNTSFVTSRVNTKAKCFNWTVLSENLRTKIQASMSKLLQLVCKS